MQGRQERWRRAHVGGAHGIAVHVSSVLKYERYQASPDITKIGREPKDVAISNIAGYDA
jgi:hypothetical protein